MRTQTVRVGIIRKHSRLDSRYHASPGVKATEAMEFLRSRGTPMRTLGGADGIGRVWKPERFRRVYAAPGEESVPYLRPYDAFDYLPVTADHLSASRCPRLAACRLRKGMILQTRSGRNLGPAVVVDDYLTRFVFSEDMIRIEIEDEDLRYYTLGFMQSEIGQQLITRGKMGSVIDHITDAHMASLPVPLLDRESRMAVSNAMRKAAVARERARLALSRMLAHYEQQLPEIVRTSHPSAGWMLRAQELAGRLDAAFHDPLVVSVRESLRAIGGVEVQAVADVLKPAGRYRTMYVDQEYGRPILSGGQLLQYHPVNLRYISPKAFADVSRYGLRRGWVIYAADGRAEEALGSPAMVASNRDGWLASGHVGRVVPKAKASSGWLWLACRTPHVQLQIRAAASGSVVDSTFPWDMLSVVLPPPLDVDSSGVARAWEGFVRAEEHERDSRTLLAAEIERLASQPLPDAVSVKPTAMPAMP